MVERNNSTNQRRKEQQNELIRMNEVEGINIMELLDANA